MGNINGINMNGKCLRVLSESLRELLGSRIVNNGEKILMPGQHGKTAEGTMLSHRSHDRARTIRREGRKHEGVGEGDVVITPLDEEMLRALVMKGSLVLLVLFAIAGCGTIAHGTSQNIACITSPAGAVVTSADGTTCTTPCSFTLKRKKDDLLTIEREGYETVTLPVHSAFSASSAANVLLPGGLVCWAIDVASGGGYRLAPDRVNVMLKPLEEREP